MSWIRIDPNYGRKPGPLPNFPLFRLTIDLLLPVFSKMNYRPFLNCRLSCHWLRDFIEENRWQINVHYPYCDEGIYFGKYKHILLKMPLKEWKAIRPKKVIISGYYQTKTGGSAFFGTERIKKYLSIIVELGWQCETHIVLDDIQESELSMVYDHLLVKDGVVPSSISTKSWGWRYSTKATQHQLLSIVPNVYLECCASPDFSFILGKHKRIKIHCVDINARTVNQMIKLVISCSIPTERVWIDFRCLDWNFVLDELLEGLSPILLYSYDSHESSILKQKVPNLSLYPELLSYMLHLIDERVAILHLRKNEFGSFKFWVFANEEELFLQVKKRLDLREIIPNYTI